MGERLCSRCKIKWDIDSLGRDCPKCKIQAFFTMNAGDIGVAMYFDQTDDEYSNYKKYPKHELKIVK